MPCSIINKIAVTPADITDSSALRHVRPMEPYADKGYCTKVANFITKRKSVHLAAIMRNNMKNKRGFR